MTVNDRYCPACGTLNVQAARFCQACGSRLVDAPGVACARCGVTALPGDRYCDACGATLPRWAVLITEDSGWRIAVPDRAENTIGREDVLSGAKPDVDLAPYGADAYGVSRQHARLRRAENGYTLEDLNSVNLTYVNDERLEPGRKIALADGDHILLGSLRLIFRQT
jgi:hypothetical protein